ncbi:MAG: NYN domain-containing protein [Chloroflexales bacterium]|nr:NYN domain-containing protein [Chloroflexales bacterium]
MPHPFPEHIKPCTVMVFVDGENLAIRWKNQLGDDDVPSHVDHEPGVFVWSKYLNMKHHLHCSIIRKHYYTSSCGDTAKHNEIFDRLKLMDIESPHVFPRTKNKGSKRVDITLSVDMLTHAYQKNYDAAVLVAGDEDYVSLVYAVKNAGRRVFLWFIENGLSDALRRSVDYYFDAGTVLCDPNAGRYFP